MHTFHLNIEKERNEKQTDFTYPAWWSEVVALVDIVAYEDHPGNHGHQKEGAVCVCDDPTWDLIEAKNDPAIEELDDVTANEKGRSWRPQVEKVTDGNVLLTVIAKMEKGKNLTTDERKAIDPDDPTPGRSKSRLFDVHAIATDRGDVLKAKK